MISESVKKNHLGVITDITPPPRPLYTETYIYMCVITSIKDCIYSEKDTFTLFLHLISGTGVKMLEYLLL